jgi:hypothetical protein
MLNGIPISSSDILERVGLERLDQQLFNSFLMEILVPFLVFFKRKEPREHMIT